MAKIKKEKYIRDLFEKNFAKKLYLYLFHFSKIYQHEFLESRKLRYKALTNGHRYIVSGIIWGLTATDKDDNHCEKIYTIQKHHENTFLFEFKALFYLQLELAKNIETVKILRDEILDLIRKNLNKSIDNFIKKNQEQFILSKPTKSNIILLTLINIFGKINKKVLKYINPQYKTKRVEPDIDKRNTAWKSVFKSIITILKSCAKHKEFSDDELVYFLKNEFDLDYLDAEVQFVLSNRSKIIKPFKPLALEYIKSYFNLSLNEYALDKALDRGEKIIEEKAENIGLIHRLDNYLSLMNVCKINLDEELFNNYKKSASTILDILK